MIIKKLPTTMSNQSLQKMKQSVLQELLTNHQNKINTHPICGPQWGDYPSDSELTFYDPYDYEDQSDDIQEPLEKDSNEEMFITSSVNQYVTDASTQSVILRDEKGYLYGIQFVSNGNTPKWWGASLTIKYSGYEEEQVEEYDQGEVDDYWREREIYDC